MILDNAIIATMQQPDPYGLIGASKDDSPLDVRGAIVVEGEEISWVGRIADLPRKYFGFERLDLKGRLVTPGLIDCHTHLVYGGDRAKEFELRLEGASYAEIAEAGGGILSTVAATRTASEEQLLLNALPRVDAMIAEGACTVEIKSGYGLDVDTELKMLRIAKRIAEVRPIRVVKTFLGAHAVPIEFRGQSDKYIDSVCLPALDQAHRSSLVDAVDGFCEGIAFSVKEIERVFEAARKLSLPVKLHAEQLSNLGGTKLAARYGAYSADHLEYATESDVQAMAQAGMIAVLLPGAFYTLRETQLPPIDLLRRHRVSIAVATDCNPGSSPLCSLLLAMNMACTLFRLTPEESLAGVTKHAAAALGMRDVGTIAPGCRADLAIWNVQHPCELAYRIGFQSLWKRVFSGAIDD